MKGRGLGEGATARCALRERLESACEGAPAAAAAWPDPGTQDASRCRERRRDDPAGAMHAGCNPAAATQGHTGRAHTCMALACTMRSLSATR